MLKLKQNFHQRVICFSGFSGSGKTTMIEKVIRKLSHRYKIGYIKHDAHQFSMDKEGKDTFTQFQAGANIVYINDKSHCALVSRGESLNLENEIFKTCDLVLVEGYKDSDLKKIVLLDDNNLMTEKIKNNEVQNILKIVKKDERDDIDSIITLIEDEMKKSIPELYGLILAGGKSSRMGQDKTSISYHKKPQGVYLYDLLSEFCTNVYLSENSEDQAKFQNYPYIKHLRDRFVGFGPSGGIATALTEFKDKAVLVLACDLPLITEENIKELILKRNPYKQATAYFNETNKRFEPLFAIYEPSVLSKILTLIGNGINCPQKVLYQSNVEVLNLKEQSFLFNANTPDEKKYIEKKLGEIYANKN